MKITCLFLLVLLPCCTIAQNLQLHYDPRHLVDSKRNSKNFTTLYFEYFKNQDSGKSFIKPGSFLLKIQADFIGEKNNMGKAYLQVSQSFRFWNPKVFLSVQYSGGLGITEPKEYSYYIMNTFSVGVNYPFRLGNTCFLASVLSLKYIPYKKPSYDPFFTQYWWQGLFKYKAEFSGDFSVWLENKNHGDDFTKQLSGKRFAFFAEPQFWYNLNKTFGVGTKVNMYYHVLTTEHLFQAYPTAAIRCKL